MPLWLNTTDMEGTHIVYLSENILHRTWDDAWAHSIPHHGVGLTASRLAVGKDCTWEKWKDTSINIRVRR